MPLNRQRAQKYLQKFDFESLFIEELGWDTVDRVTLPFEVDGEPFEVVSITQKRGFTVFKCITPEIPTRPIRVKLDRQLTDYSKSHLLVFGDEGKTQQIWMWVRQELGKPLAPRFEQYQVGQSAERLLQKLEALAIAFAEEEKLTLVEVAQRVKKAFDVEKVTKKFFTRFEKEHGQFLQFIDGIQSEFDRTWYASLMLNRLMFVYFIQKKNFLDGDVNYLRNRLKRCQTEWGTDTFHTFYRQFLLKLFHEGLGKPDRNPELDQLLGKIPYLNGGLFEVHQLEEKYDSTLQIPDAAFEQVFNFFDDYDWHLDDRPLRNQNEINPDVLGYIFEKYINQKQMGAYYTKEDITEYISKNTILPFLFDAAKKRCPAAFRPHPLAPASHALRSTPKEAEGEPEVSLTPLSRSGRGAGGEGKPRYEYFRKVLTEMAKHPNPRYFVLKSIMLNNLYGVDIMEEATEICKLRLFLKLVAQMEPQPKKANFGLEPLPDIDFNIRAGNTLVGFAGLEEVRKAISQEEVKSKKTKGKGRDVEADQFKLDLQDDASRINEKAKLADRAFQRFRQMHTEFGMDAGDFRTAKQELRRRLAELNGELNHYLAREYGVEVEGKSQKAKGKSEEGTDYERWLASHQPFHWFVEFYSIIDRGGFDVIIGNPPYVEYSKIKNSYSIKNYRTENCGNLYAYVIERCQNIIYHFGYLGMIVLLSAFCTSRMSEIWFCMSHNFNSHWISHYGFRPSKLFDGVNLRLAIALPGQQKGIHQAKCYTSKFNKWSSEQRDLLLESLYFIDANSGILGCKTIPKMSNNLEHTIIEKIISQPRKISDLAQQGKTFIVYYKNTGVNYWITVTDFQPKAFRGDQPSASSRQTEFAVITPASLVLASPCFDSAQHSTHRGLSAAETLSNCNVFDCQVNSSQAARNFTLCILNSNLFFYFYTVKSNCRDLNPSDIKEMPIPLDIESNDLFSDLASELMKSLDEKSEYITRDQKQTGSIRLQSFYPSLSKPIIDQIDRVLARHYGLTDEELDFIINYDIKYRMGQDNGGDD